MDSEEDLYGSGGHEHTESESPSHVYAPEDDPNERNAGEEVPSDVQNDPMNAPTAGYAGIQHLNEGEALKRMNLAIRPDQSAWKERYREFKRLLSQEGKFLEDILIDNFTLYEARTFVPTDESELKRIQKHNTERYYALLDARFKSVKPSLATKLTMMYFGLPVEPMISSVETLHAEMETREHEGQRYDVDPPLHFLTAHDHRNWGKDSMRGREAIAWPIPLDVDPPRLRGGAAPDEDEDSEPEWDYAPDDEEQIGAKDEIFYLFGFQGCIPVVPYKWRSYAKAVRKLLSIRPMDGSKQSYSLIQFDKTSSSIISTTHDTLPLTATSPSMRQILRHFANAPVSSHKNCCAFFVKFKDEHSPTHWEPQPEQIMTDLVRISFAPLSTPVEEGPVSHAYIPFPKATKGPFQAASFAANQYNQYFQAIVEVLAGRPDESFHRATFKLIDETASDAPCPVYGGMSQPGEIWNQLSPRNNPIGSWIMKESKLEKEEIAFVIPNWVAPQGLCCYLTSDDFSRAEELIRNMLESIYPDEVMDTLDRILVLPGLFALGQDLKRNADGFTLYADPKDKLPGQSTLKELLDQFVINDQEPFVVIHPEWEQDTTFLYAGWDPSKGSRKKRTDLPHLGSSIAEIRNAVRRLSASTNRHPAYIPDTHYILLKPESIRNGRDVMDFDSLVIGPESTEDDWYRIRLHIISPNVQAFILDKKEIDWRAQISKSNIWGPRYTVDSPPARTKKTVAVVEETPKTPENPIPSGRPPKTGPSRRVSTKPKDSERIPERTKSTHREPRETREPIQPSPTPTPRERRKKASKPAEKAAEEPPPSPKLPPVRKSRRAETWTNQPSVYDPQADDATQPGYKVPINAPPKEPIFRTSHRTPMFTKALLTPSEQGNLQNSFWDIRNIVLNRVYPCAYTDCSFTCRIDDRAAMEEHVQNKHGGERCMWCDDSMHLWWTDTQKIRHLAKKHPEKLQAAVEKAGISERVAEIEPEEVTFKPKTRGKGVSAESQMTSPSRKARHPVDESEEVHYFCDRCGRDRRQFETLYEKEYHDRSCFHSPGAIDYHIFCALCGGRDWENLKLAQQAGFASEYPHHCSNDDEDAEPRFCTKCGVDMDPLSLDQQISHYDNCRGFGYYTGIFCNWCSKQLITEVSNAGEVEEAMQHMRNCYKEHSVPKAFTSPWKLLRNGREGGRLSVHDFKCAPDFYNTTRLLIPPRLLFPLEGWYDYQGPVKQQGPVVECPIYNCKDPHLGHLGSGDIYRHFVHLHPDRLDSCPFCKCSFDIQDNAGRTTGRSPPEEVIKHFDCHVYCLWERMEVGEDMEMAPLDSFANAAWGNMLQQLQLGKVQLELGRSLLAQVESFQLQRCPFFEDCGSCIGQMTKTQFKQHLADTHQLEFPLNRSELDRINWDEISHDAEAITELTRFETVQEWHDWRRERDRKRRLDIEVQEEEEEEDERDPSPPSKRKRRAGTQASRKKSRPSKTPSITPSIEIVTASDAVQEAASDEPLYESEDSLFVSDSEIEKRRAKRAKADPKKIGKYPVKKPAAKADNEDDDWLIEEDESEEGDAKGDDDFEDNPDEEDEDGDDDGGSDGDSPRGRPQKGGPRRRAASPDWNKQLGAGSDSFEPTEAMYCSKCLRKAPKMRDRSPGRSPLGRNKEMELHTDPARSCGIRNGVGVPEKLPNRSGWIPASEIPGPVGALKQKFIKRYPAYERTLYPIHKSDIYSSLWRSDPNNEENKEFWGIPWPPYEGDAPFPGWDAPDVPESDNGGGSKKRRLPMLKPVPDPSYQYRSDEDSAEDEVQAGEIEAEEDDGKKPTKKGAKKTKKKPAAAAAAAPTSAPAAGTKRAATDTDSGSSKRPRTRSHTASPAPSTLPESSATGAKQKKPATRKAKATKPGGKKGEGKKTEGRKGTGKKDAGKK